jgi:hypothetical protein
MAKYVAKRDTWLSHECRLVSAGEEFDTEFPAGMKLADNLELVEQKKAKAKPAEEVQQ